VRVIRIIEMPAVDAALARAGLWWNGLSPRERVLVGTLGVLLAIAVVVYGVVKPLQAIRADALADIRTYETLNARIRAAGTLGQAGPPPRTGPAPAIVTASASSVGLTVTTEATPGGVRASATDAGYDAVLAWLADLARTSGLSVTRVDLQRGSAPGRVNAVVEFRE